MKVTLQRFGNDYALVFDSAMMEALKMRPNSLLEITPGDESFNVKPMENLERRARFEKALEDVNRKFGRALKKLAES